MSIIGQNIRHLRKQGLKVTQEKLGTLLGLGRGAISAYEDGRAEPKIDSLIKLSKLFNISIDELVHQDLSLETLPLTSSSLAEYTTGHRLRILSITLNEKEEENVEFVPKKAAAGYTTGYANEKFLVDLPKYKLPFLPKGKTYRAFEITGDSMLPILPHSIVIGAYIPNFNEVKEGQTCVVITNDGIVLKKVYNRIPERQTLLLQSSNVLYEPYEVAANEVLELWGFVAYIGKELPEVQTNDQDLRQALDMLKIDLMELKAKVR